MMKNANDFVDSFDKAETIGRLKLQSIFNQSGTEGFFSADKYNQIDCIAITKAGKKIAVEVKDRDLIDKNGKMYPTIVLSPNKVETLNNYVSSTGFDEAYYTCFAGDDAYIFDVVHTPYVEGEIYVSNTTVGDDKRKSLKPVYYYNIHDAVHLKLVEGKWVKQKGGERSAYN